jgi:hypothetical protein
MSRTQWIITNDISDLLREPQNYRKLDREVGFNDRVMIKNHLKILTRDDLWVKPHYTHVTHSHPRTKLHSEVRFQNELHDYLASMERRHH